LNYTRELNRNNHYTRSANGDFQVVKHYRAEPLQYWLWK